MQWDANEGECGADVDDAAPIPRPHPFQGGLGPHTWPRNVTSTARLKSAESVSQMGEKAVVMASLTHTSIGPELGFGPGGGVVDLAVVGDVGGDGDGLAAEGLDLFGSCGKARFAAGEERDVIAELGERGGGGPAAPRRMLR